MPSGRTAAGVSRSTEAGYAMVALLVSLNIMAIMLTVAMPVWRQMVQREREVELVFRGEQYRRAIQLYERRNGPGVLPPDLDALIEGRFLRKAFKDPITGGDFVLIRQGQEQPGVPASAAAGPGPIVGVVSSSRQRSIRIYEGQTVYDQWLFVHSGGESPGGDGQGGGSEVNGAGRGGRGAPAGAGRGRGFAGRGAAGRGGRGADIGRGRGSGSSNAGRGGNPSSGRGVAP